MVSNRLAFAGLAVACVAAAGGGGYLATRQDIAPAPVEAAVPAVPGSAAVHETESVVVSTTEPKTLASEAAQPAPVEAPRAVAAKPTPASAPARSAPARVRKPEASAPVVRVPEPPALERSWPSSAAQQGTQAALEPAPVPAAVEDRAAEPVRPQEPPPPQFEELIVSANSVVGLQMVSALSSERAAVEDRVEARVVRDVRSGGEVAIPAGSRALGSVMIVERGGRFKERARLGIRFHTLLLADGTRLPVTTETIYRYGDAPGNGSAAKIGGGAVAGAILGAIIGGAKGAAVGATAGAGGGTAAVMAGDRSAAQFPAGAEVTARLISPVSVTIEK